MLHEVLLLLFKNRPALAPELLRDALGVELPAHTEVRVDCLKAPRDYACRRSSERRASTRSSNGVLRPWAI